METIISGESASPSEAVNKKKLNPLAKEWDPAKERPPEERRCLYIAFSSHHPFNEDEIIHFFHQTFGRCVENVYVQRAEGNQAAAAAAALMFGKVVFHFSCIPLIVLGKENQVRFTVNSKTLWCLRFDPFNPTTHAHA